VSWLTILVESNGQGHFAWFMCVITEAQYVWCSINWHISHWKVQVIITHIPDTTTHQTKQHTYKTKRHTRQSC